MTRADLTLDAGVVDARLRQLAALSARVSTWPPLVDMSAHAVTSRLRECAEISALALALCRAGAAAGLSPAVDPDPG